MKNTLKFTLSLITFLFVFWGLSTPVFAESNDMFTFGVGTEVLYTTGGEAAQETNIREDSFGVLLTARVKFLYILGLEFAYNPTKNVGDIYLLTYRLTGNLYLFNFNRLGLYLSAGTSADQVGDLFNIESPNMALRAGLGLEIHITDNVTITAQAHVIVPGVGYYNNKVNTHIASNNEDLPKFSPEDPREHIEISGGLRLYY